MRLWHKDLIDVLPREQLVSQWREASSIAGNLQIKGTPNHLLVNKILNYDIDHFISYSYYVRQEMTRRGYKTMDKVWNKITSLKPNWQLIKKEDLFPNWHTNRYLRQCFYNLEEKYDCSGIKWEDFDRILWKLNPILNLGYEETNSWLK